MRGGGGRGARAACDNPRIISSLYPRGTLSYVQTPGVVPDGNGSSVTDSLRGVFWALGQGDPTPGRGSDSGAFAALGDAGWIQTPAGYPATIHTEWSAAAAIDGCVDRAAGPRCVAVLLSDQRAGQSYFALVTATPTTLGHYSLVQPDTVPIVLAPLGAPNVADVVNLPALTSASVSVGGVSGGLYFDSDCPVDLISGFRIYARKVNRGSPTPTDLRRDAAHGWFLAVGGETATGEPRPLGTSATVSSDCSSNQDLYFAVSLVLESGFETAYVSRPAQRIRCGSTF